MNILTVLKENTNLKLKNVKQIKLKAAILDRFLEIIEDECLVCLMEGTEKEKNISFSKARMLMK